MTRLLFISAVYIASAATIALWNNLPIISVAQHLLCMNWMLIRCCAVIQSMVGVEGEGYKAALVLQ